MVMSVKKKTTVLMKVTTTIEFPPEARDTSDKMAIELAMTAVSQLHEVDCGPVGKIVWAKVYSEVSDDECEVVEVSDD